MKRICPTCFTELPEEANYCSTCGKCMREVEEYTIQYTGATPQTKEVSIKDCAVSFGDFDDQIVTTYKVAGKPVNTRVFRHYE